MRRLGMLVLGVSFGCTVAAQAQTSPLQRSMRREAPRATSDRLVNPGNTFAGSFRTVSLPPSHIRTADYSCLSSNPCVVGDPGYPAVGYRRNAGPNGSIIGASADIMELANAQGPWWNDKGWIQQTPNLSTIGVPDQRGPEVAYDVTNAVRRLNDVPRGDYGLVLMSNDLDLRNKPINSSALSQYAYDPSLRLEVQYH